MIIVVDVETTGLHPDKNGIVSIGAVVYDDPTKLFTGELQNAKHFEAYGSMGGAYSSSRKKAPSPPPWTTPNMIERFNGGGLFYEECRVRDGAVIDPKALVVNGFTETEIRDENKFSEARLVKHFAEWWKSIDPEDNIIAGHNVHFDWGFLNTAFIQNNVALLINKRILDLHSLCMASLLRRGKSVGEIHSDFLMSYVGLPTEPKPHNALNGAQWETEAFGRLIEGKNKLPQFSRFPTPDYL